MHWSFQWQYPASGDHGSNVVELREYQLAMRNNSASGTATIPLWFLWYGEDAWNFTSIGSGLPTPLAIDYPASFPCGFFGFVSRFGSIFVSISRPLKSWMTWQARSSSGRRAFEGNAFRRISTSTCAGFSLPVQATRIRSAVSTSSLFVTDSCSARMISSISF